MPSSPVYCQTPMKISSSNHGPIDRVRTENATREISIKEFPYNFELIDAL